MFIFALCVDSLKSLSVVSSGVKGLGPCYKKNNSFLSYILVWMYIVQCKLKKNHTAKIHIRSRNQPGSLCRKHVTCKSIEVVYSLRYTKFDIDRTRLDLQTDRPTKQYAPLFQGGGGGNKIHYCINKLSCLPDFFSHNFGRIVW